MHTVCAFQLSHTTCSTSRPLSRRLLTNSRTVTIKAINEKTIITRIQKMKGVSSEMPADVSKEVPIFLRKTYHLIDSCEPSVASWSHDGETFTVKHPERFEKEFIPQFFKHSKFSSFVRQLNFYGFRKLKYSDNIRIDPKDAETANYWRFKHEHFVRGKPDLLKNIRRSQSSQAIPITDKPYEQPEKKPEEVELLRCEVDVLKDRIAKMSANIDELTGLVNKITITDDNHASAGSKRKLVKVEEVCSLDDCKSDDASFAGPMIVATDEDMDHISLEPDTVLSSFYATPANLCSTSSMSSISPSRNISLLPEDDFVDDLFASFSDDPIEAFPDPVTSMTISSQLHSIHTESNMLQDKSSPVSKIHPNAPDPALIARLSEALTILPRDVQELLVNRLIATITASDSLMNHLDAVYKSSPESCKNQEHKNNPCVSIPYISIHA